MTRTTLDIDERLPLTCTLTGTCCHGKAIGVNPWELACLALAENADPRRCRDTHCSDGGIRLRMDGAHRWRNRASCTFFADGQGCTVHSGRPLACRLYPLGRERQGNDVRYVHDGSVFPCLDGCLEVADLPAMTVKRYLAEQEVTVGEQAQDAYLEIVQDLAEGAFVLLLDTPLHKSEPSMLAEWQRIGLLNGDLRARRLGKTWIDALTLPGGNPAFVDDFIANHRAQLKERAEAAFGSFHDLDAVRQGCATMLLLACHLGASLGAEPNELCATWIATAKTNGAR